MNSVRRPLSVTRSLRSMVTPFNLAALLAILAGGYVLFLRFTQGLAAAGASDDLPLSLLLGWGLFSGVPLSASGFVLGTAVYLFGLKQYHPVVRNAILIGFLGYFFAVVFLLIDLGRPWRIYYPMFISYGPASVLFLVAWHVALYLSCQALEFSPAVFEWLKRPALRKWALAVTIGATIFGVILSTLHQSALGAMFLLMQGRLHPLWYSPYLPWLFFISAIAAGLCMVIFVGWLNERFHKRFADAEYLRSIRPISLGLGKGVVFVLWTYLALKLIALTHGSHWDLLSTSWGQWYLVEVFGFAMAPALLLLWAVRQDSVTWIRVGALWTVLGVIFNRLTVSMFAYDYDVAHREIFHLTEIGIIVGVVAIELLVYRWIISRMPVLREHPEYDSEF